MAITFGSITDFGGNTVVTSQAVSLGTHAAGSLAVVFITWHHTTSAPTFTVTDTKGNAYTVSAVAFNNYGTPAVNVATAIAWAPVTSALSGSDSVTVTSSQSGIPRLAVANANDPGIALTVTKLVSGINAALVASYATSTTFTEVSGEVGIYVVGYYHGTNVLVTPSGWTYGGNVATAVDANGGMYHFNRTGAASTQPPSASFSSFSDTYAGVAGVIGPAPAGPSFAAFGVPL